MNQKNKRLKIIPRFKFSKKKPFWSYIHTAKMKQKNKLLTYGCTSFTKRIENETTNWLIGAYIFWQGKTRYFGADTISCERHPHANISFKRKRKRYYNRLNLSNEKFIKTPALRIQVMESNVESDIHTRACLAQYGTDCWFKT